MAWLDRSYIEFDELVPPIPGRKGDLDAGGKGHLCCLCVFSFIIHCGDNQEEEQKQFLEVAKGNEGSPQHWHS